MTDPSKKSTEQKTSIKEKCLREAIVSDKFKRMIDKAFIKTKSILQKRYEDLYEWGDNQQKEFSSIFGIDGKETILIKNYIPGQQIDPENAKSIPRNTPLEIEMHAHDFMLDGVKRLIDLCNEIDTGDRECDEDWGAYRYGNFLNETAINMGVARVAKGQTLNKLPDKYKENIRIEILYGFKELKNVTGYNSQVATLCHELSHLIIYKEKGIYYGGMGTDDILPKGIAKTHKNYMEYADILVQEKSKQVFNNAYNIEKYFEIKI